MTIRRLFALCVLVLLAGCRQPTTSEVRAIVEGSGNVQIATLQILPGSDTPGGPGSNFVYYVCKVDFANTTASDVTPATDHFVFTTNREHTSFHALTTGIPPSVEIANPTGPVGPGNKQEYTLVFRTLPGATGTVVYQP